MTKSKIMEIKIGQQFKVKEDMPPLAKDEIVEYTGKNWFKSKTYDWEGVLCGYDIKNLEPIETWCTMIQHDRYQLLGKLIDAMIYSHEALSEVKGLVKQFEEKGLVKSKIG